MAKLIFSNVLRQHQRELDHIFFGCADVQVVEDDAMGNLETYFAEVGSPAPLFLRNHGFSWVSDGLAAREIASFEDDAVLGLKLYGAAALIDAQRLGLSVPRRFLGIMPSLRTGVVVEIDDTMVRSLRRFIEFHVHGRFEDDGCIEEAMAANA
jgi:hypothetical protein